MKSMQRFGGVLLAAWLVTIGTGAPASAGDKVDLKLRLKVGKKYSLQIRSDQKATQSMGGQQQTADSSTDFVISMRPKKVNDKGDMTILVRYESIKVKTKSLLGAVDYDSEKPPSRATDPLGSGFAAMVGKSFTMTMRPTGEVIDVQGADVLLDGVLKGLPLPEGQIKAAVTDALRARFGPEAIKQSLMGPGSAIFPEKPVAVGDSWSAKKEVTAGFAMMLDATWKLKSVGDNAATIAINGKITTDPKKTIDMGMMKVAYDLSGEQDGTQVVNLKSGWIKEATLHQVYKGTMKMVGLPGNSGDMGVPMTVDAKTTIKSVKKNSKASESSGGGKSPKGSKSG